MTATFDRAVAQTTAQTMVLGKGKRLIINLLFEILVFLLVS